MCKADLQFSFCAAIHFPPCSGLILCYLPPLDVSIAKEIQKRRTFAIISHPDAGKTTLTEKLVLSTRG
jgi:hypothetical protein